MKIKNSGKLIASVSAILLISGLIITSSTKDSSGVIFELNTADLTDTNFQGNVVNSQIFCKINVQTDVIDNSGNVIGTEKSPFFSGSPSTTFSFIDETTGKELNDEGGFLVSPSIKCASSASNFDEDFDGTVDESEDPFCDGQSFLEFCIASPTVETPLKVKTGTFTVKVFSNSPDGMVETFNTQLNYDEITITDSTAKKMGEANIGADRILVYIPPGQYDSEQKIVVYGNVDIVWRDFPSVDYRLSLDENDVPTYRTITIDKQSEEKPEPIPCAEGEQRISDVCVRVNGGNDSPTPSVSELGYFEKLSVCLNTGDTDCLFETQYMFLGLGLFGVIVIGLASSQRPRETVYGVR